MEEGLRKGGKGRGKGREEINEEKILRSTLILRNDQI